MTELLSAVLGALLGAFGAILGSIVVSARQDRQEMTTKIIEEFFSNEFLLHRISLSRTWDKVNAGQVATKDIAGGYWYPGVRASYAGDISSGLTEHQHIEAYLGFLVRIYYLQGKNRIDVGQLASTLGMGLIHHLPVLVKIAVEARQQVGEASAELPNWISAVDFAERRLVPTDLPLSSR